MKILFAIKGMNEAKGGAERVLADVTAGLAGRGHEISLLTFDGPSAQTFYPLSHAVKRLPLNSGDTSKSANLKESLSRIVGIRKIVRQEKPDLIIAFMHSMFIPLAFSCIGLGIPVVGSEHIVPEHYKTRRLEFFLFMLASFFIKKITVLSDPIRAAYPRFLQGKMVVVPNPVKEAEGSARLSEDGLKTILNVGRLEEQKDQETLIRAFASLEKNFPGWQVMILGEGALRQSLQKLIEDLGMDGKVILKGTTPDIGMHYASAQIFALPSLYESFGLATAEAMSYGLPAIGFQDCPGTNELIADGQNGILVMPAKDRVQSFADGLRRLMENAPLRINLGNAAKESVSAYKPSRIVDLWERLLKDVSLTTNLTKG